LLIHRRKVGEALRIGDSVEIRIISVGKKVVLGIIAPREVSVVACRVSGAAMDNTIAASLSADMDRKLRAASRKATPVILSLLQEAPETPPKVSDND
jgi:carbon storage regulator CsrA